MKKQGMNAFLASCLLWLLPGLAAGVLCAAILSSHEYGFTARLTGAILEGQSLPAAMKDRLQTENKEDFKEGRRYLEQYGHHRWGTMPLILPYTIVFCLILFEAAGCAVFYIRRRDWKYQEKRIRELAAYLQAADSGKAVLLTRREDAFSHLEDAIYKTVASLASTKEDAVKDHQILAARIADIAHQLKTPLTSMSLMAELLEPSRKEEEEYLERLRRQIERLKGLADGLLVLARLDSHTLEFCRQDLGVEELLYEAAGPLKEMMDQKQIKLTIQRAVCEGQKAPADIRINADMQWTSEAFINILKNCVEHTLDQGTIRIEYGQNPIYTQILIEDGGCGFSKKDLPHLFDRFYRGEHAAKDSAGIGLALSRLILEAQNGHVHAENSPAGHARFIIRFYKD